MPLSSRSGGGAFAKASLAIEGDTVETLAGSSSGGGDGNNGDDDVLGDKQQQTGGCWSAAVTAGSAALPRDASTCILWCAIALGALVRGRPLSQVGGVIVGLVAEILCLSPNTVCAQLAFPAYWYI